MNLLKCHEFRNKYANYKYIIQLCKKKPRKIQLTNNLIDSIIHNCIEQGCSGKPGYPFIPFIIFYDNALSR